MADRIPVILDVDTGVDDALAILLVLGSPEAELLALASTAGNVELAHVVRNNLALLELCGLEGVEVAVGIDRPLVAPLRTAVSHGPRGLGYATLAEPRLAPSGRSSADLVVEEARRRPGEIVLVATGPLTNVALAVRREPALPRLLRRLVVMGGAYACGGNTTPVAEFNVAVDPEAAKMVFEAFSHAPVDSRPLLCGLDVTETVAMRPEHVERLAAVAGSSNPVIRCVADALRFHMEAYERHGYGALSHLHDPLAAAAALRPELVATRPATVDVELAGSLTRGETVADWRGHWGREANAEVAVGVDPDAILDLVVERIGALALEVGR